MTFGVRWCGEDFRPLSNSVCTLPSTLARPTLDCGSTSTLMCYHAPRLAFDYNTELRGMSCISITLRPSTGVSPGFSLVPHRSTRFASDSCDFTPFQTSALKFAARLVSLRLRLVTQPHHTNQLPGQCFKTDILTLVNSIPVQPSPVLGSSSLNPFTPIYSLC